MGQGREVAGRTVHCYGLHIQHESRLVLKGRFLAACHQMDVLALTKGQKDRGSWGIHQVGDHGDVWS